MIPASLPENETERQASLERMHILSTPREADLDRVTRLAKRLFGVEIALISLVDRDRQWFKSRFGLDACETPRNISFCGHAINNDDLFIVLNAVEDTRFHDNPLVIGDPGIRFYAGCPLSNAEGHRIGTLCVISPHPREVTDDEREALRDLGRLAEWALAARELSETRCALLDELDVAKRESLIDPLSGLWNHGGVDALVDREIARAARDKEPLAVAFVDIDHFKKINDQYGHARGDDAIRLTADILTQSMRPYDIVGRYGGEEFLIAIKGMGSDNLPAIGGKLLKAIRARARLPVDAKSPHVFTASVGLTAASSKDGTAFSREALFRIADNAMYQAKQGGRDRYVIATVGQS